MIRGREIVVRALNGARGSAVRLVLGCSMPGVVLATVLFWQSLWPSLLPRTWLMQGVLSGLCLVVGYAVGAVLGSVFVSVWNALGIGRRVPPQVERRARFALAAVALVVTVYAFTRSAEQQEWNWTALGVDRPQGYRYGGVLLVALLICAVALYFVLAVRGLGRWLYARGVRRMPGWSAWVFSAAVTLTVLALVLNQGLYNGSLSAFNRSMSGADVELASGAPARPSSSLLSGSPDSSVGWASLGRQGRRFISRAPDAAQIEEISGRPAIQPVRVFVGRSSAPTVAGRVALAMRELERTGAFERKAIVVNTPTGTGWMNEQLFQPVEYFFGGDTAVVGVQYSHLPSPLAFLSETDGATATGTQLFDAVYERIRSIRAGGRPKLFVTGESLGSYGGQSAFASFAALRARADNALWVGTPAFTGLRGLAERTRRPGSPQMAPVVGDDRAVLFANRGSDLEGKSPQVVYLQNADDPIVWWDPDLAFDRPDWLRERLDPSVNPGLRWRPMATFLQLSVDMAVGNDFDEGNGHLYGTLPLTAWVQMLDPPGWDRQRVGALREHLSGVG